MVQRLSLEWSSNWQTDLKFAFIMSFLIVPSRLCRRGSYTQLNHLSHICHPFCILGREREFIFPLCFLIWLNMYMGMKVSPPCSARQTWHMTCLAHHSCKTTYTPPNLLQDTTKPIVLALIILSVTTYWGHSLPSPLFWHLCLWCQILSFLPSDLIMTSGSAEALEDFLSTFKSRWRGRWGSVKKIKVTNKMLFFIEDDWLLNAFIGGQCLHILNVGEDMLVWAGLPAGFGGRFRSSANLPECSEMREKLCIHISYNSNHDYSDTLSLNNDCQALDPLFLCICKREQKSIQQPPIQAQSL